MLLNIEHTTQYHYPDKINGIVQSTKLIPSEYNGLKIFEWNVKRDSKNEGSKYIDAEGNNIMSYSEHSGVESIKFSVTGKVETLDTNGVFKSKFDKLSPYIYLRNTYLTEPSREICDLANAANENQNDSIQTAHNILSFVAESIEYTPYTTNSNTSAAEAFKQGKGVCQDQAHIMISAARFLGIPARYINGYMHNNKNSSEFQSTHAWAELFFENLGWVGFDPTNMCSPDERYIRVSSGLDANCAAPIKGTIYGSSSENLKINVETQQINSQQ